MLAGSTFLCLLAAALFWATNALQIVEMARQQSTWSSFDKTAYFKLLPDDIEYEWSRKMDVRGLDLSSTFIKAAFWIVFSFPVTEMAWVLSRNGTRSLGCNFGIMIFALAGSWSKWFTSIFWNGMYLSMVMLARRFNLDNWLDSEQARNYGVDGEDGIGWRTLEVNYIVTRGLMWVVDAAEWLCLAVIFTLTFFSVLEWRKEDQSSFGGKWNALGLFIAFVGLVEFGLVVAGAEGVGLAWLFFILYSALCRLILIPLWIIILGFQLPNATKQIGSFTSELELSEVQQLGNQSNLSNFTIDDDGAAGTQPFSGPSSPPAEAFAPAKSLSNN